MRSPDRGDVGSALSALGIAAGIVGALYPEQRALLWAVAAVCVLIAVLLLLRRPEIASVASLALESSTDNLCRAYPADFHRNAIGQYGRTFALLRVRNESASNLHVAARCLLVQSAEELPCYWFREPGDGSLSEGDSATELRAGEGRYLLIAQAFSEHKVWARLSKDRATLFSPPGQLTRAGGYHVAQFWSGKGELLDLGSNVLLEAVFYGEGLERQRRRLRLSFKRGRAIIASI